MDYQIERYSLIFWTKDGKVGFDTSKGPEGDWVRYADHARALAEAQAEIAQLRRALQDIAGMVASYGSAEDTIRSMAHIAINTLEMAG